ncbi:winged helix DNA-binding domain-containing protein [Actinospica sp.]|uniref:winged helix DNA-binding domain-containing protein n=1 Tax=Actinospica sp. TaxID=1872142 RepID=UPI002C034EB8|nr:winged helix DNA-binding domain-containing protein [Actinospica sp.]HWG23018.1 winged helix DNA-binding domain-containing protein [Actinospica sp.]
MPTTPPTLSRRALNRATLSRQLLLERGSCRPYDAIHALAGMQAQAPLAPHVGLWTRLAHYSPAALDELYDARRVVRSNLMRATVHLVTTDDALAWQGLTGPISARTVQSAFGRRLTGIDLDALTSTALDLLVAAELSTAELGQQLAQRFPGYDADALAYGARGRLALIHVPPRGKWNASAPTRQTTFAAFLGREPEAAPSPDGILLRYLAAFGPASVQDAQAWSGLTRLSEVADRLSPKLTTFRDPDGRLLYDLRDAPRPSEFVSAPVRFLPEYDNVFFGYADRTRFIPDLRKPPIPPGNGARTGTLFVDGEWRGTWKIALPRKTKSSAGSGGSGKPGGSGSSGSPGSSGSSGSSERTVLAISLFHKVNAAEREAIEREGSDLARFIAGEGLEASVEISLGS